MHESTKDIYNEPNKQNKKEKQKLFPPSTRTQPIYKGKN